MNTDKITVDRMDEMMRAAFRELDARGGKVKGSEVIASIEPKLHLSDYERTTTATGAVRWETHLRFYTSDCVRAGYIQKSSGYWTLTDEGRKALALPAGELIRTALRASRAWRESKAEDPAEPLDATAAEDKANHQAILDKAIETAQAQIEERIHSLDPYDFQNMVKELLEAMGYHVPYVAPPGADGGIDLVAYKDPLGATAPRIKCQIKHKSTTKSPAKELRELESLLRKDGDMGLFVSSGGFTSDAERELRALQKHVETINLERLIDLWKEHYTALSEAGKALLPLTPVYYVTPDEA